MAQVLVKVAGVGILILIGWGIDVANFIPQELAFLAWGLAALWGLYWLVQVRRSKPRKMAPKAFARELQNQVKQKGYLDYAVESPSLMMQIDTLVGKIDSQLVGLSTVWYVHLKVIRETRKSGNPKRMRDVFQKAGRFLMPHIALLEPMARELGELALAHQDGIKHMLAHRENPVLPKYTAKDVAEAQTLASAADTRRQMLALLRSELQNVVSGNYQQDFTQGISGLLDVFKDIDAALGLLQESAKAVIQASEEGKS